MAHTKGRNPSLTRNSTKEYKNNMQYAVSGSCKSVATIGFNTYTVPRKVPRREWKKNKL